MPCNAGRSKDILVLSLTGPKGCVGGKGNLGMVGVKGMKGDSGGEKGERGDPGLQGEWLKVFCFPKIYRGTVL